MSKVNRKVCVAPMMDCTDRHDRYFLRLISKNVMLYSEMIATGAILKGKQKNVLKFRIKFRKQNRFVKIIFEFFREFFVFKFDDRIRTVKCYNFD